jgi:hypothetical protein
MGDKGGDFSKTLARLRREAGFPTAYRFFFDNGGAAGFGMTYRRYLLIEQGRNLPLVDKLEKILVGLRLPQNTPAATELVKSWLRTMAGGETYSHILEPLFAGGPAAGPSQPAQEALRRSLAEKKFHMTERQLAATLESFETYKCGVALENDAGSWTPAELARALGMKEAAARRGLETLAEAGLAKRSGKGSYRSVVAGRLVEYPVTAAMNRETRGKIKGYLARLESEGSLEYSSMGLLRADAAAFKGYYPMLHAGVEASNAYAVTRGTGSSAAYFVVGRVLKLWDF